ncbi:hypothetical protein, partial [Stenotrophomonas maltophilia]|uniref:hypothetical protein n=1 Tax=Stenotrophomonas maltophilia TaxID=40324 RepID=UPI001953DF9F
ISAVNLVANARNVTVTANGDISASTKGIVATTIGTGRLDVAVGSGVTVQSTGIYGVHLTNGSANTLTNNGAISGQTGVQTTNGSVTVTN